MSYNNKSFKWEEDLAKGTAININPNNATDLSKMQFMLRNFSQKAVYVLDQECDISNVLENIRNYIKSGQFDLANDEIRKAENTKELSQEYKLEILIEKCRRLTYENKYYEALDLSSLFISYNCTNEISVMTMHQIRSDLLLKVGRIDEAYENALKATSLAQKNIFASSAVTSFVFLAIIQAELGQVNEAICSIDYIDSKINSIESNEIWLDRQVLIQRGRFKVFQKINKWETATLALYSALDLAKLTGQKHIIERCQNDIEQNSAYLVDIKDKYLCLYMNEYTYFKHLKFIYDNISKSLIRLNLSPIRVELIELLMKGYTNKETLFSLIWQLPYSKDKHAPLIRNHLSRIKKLLPRLII